VGPARSSARGGCSWKKSRASRWSARTISCRPHLGAHAAAPPRGRPPGVPCRTLGWRRTWRANRARLRGRYSLRSDCFAPLQKRAPYIYIEAPFAKTDGRKGGSDGPRDHVRQRFAGYLWQTRDSVSSTVIDRKWPIPGFKRVNTQVWLNESGVRRLLGGGLRNRAGGRGGRWGGGEVVVAHDPRGVAVHA
jgi:hypothetical protein